MYVNGVNLAYATAGAGYPVLFITGLSYGGWFWEQQVPAFADRFRVLTFDNRGSGQSDKPDLAYTAAMLADDTVGLMRGLGMTRAHIIGHSMGGFVAQKYLERHPAAGVALLCSVPPQGLIAAQFHLLLQRPQLFMDINRIMGGEYTDIATLREALFAGEVDPAMLSAWLTRMQTESHRAIWDMSMFNLPQLHSMRRPPLLVVGAEHDVLVPAFLVQATALTYGQGAHILRGMGHAITHETDWRQGAELLRAWLDDLDLPA